jgi:hypothetical protein
MKRIAGGCERNHDQVIVINVLEGKIQETAENGSKSWDLNAQPETPNAFRKTPLVQIERDLKFTTCPRIGTVRMERIQEVCGNSQG